MNKYDAGWYWVEMPGGMETCAYYCEGVFVGIDELGDQNDLIVLERCVRRANESQKAMPEDDKAAARDCLEMAQSYAKGGIRFFPVIISNDDEVVSFAVQNMQRLSRAASS